MLGLKNNSPEKRDIPNNQKSIPVSSNVLSLMRYRSLPKILKYELRYLADSVHLTVCR